jgi:hypothetical protein
MTGRIVHSPGDGHKEVQLLLPWYQAGGLNEVERARVKAHVGQCAECQADLRDEPRLAAAIAGLPVDASLPDVEHGWTLISRQLAQGAPKPASATAWAALFDAERSKAVRAPRRESAWLRWAVAAQFSLLLALSLALWMTMQPARYHALGAAPASAAGNIVVIFRPQTPESDFRAILNDSHARLVDGPTVADAYLLRVPAADRAAALARLRRQAQVVVAEPVDSGTTR